jgi:hypothetical protein
MHENNLLYPGLKAFISVARANYPEMMHTEVNYVDNKSVSFLIPRKNGSLWMLPAGSDINVCFYKDAGRYSFDTLIEGHLVCNQKNVFICGKPDNIEKDRRKYPRVKTNFPVIIKFAEGAAEGKEVFCTSISSEGILIDSCFGMDEGTVVDIDFIGALNGLGKARGVLVPAPEKRMGVGIHLTQIVDADKDKIIGYVSKKHSLDGK